MNVGQVVFSKCGRDKGFPFIIISIENDYIYLIDGTMRLICKPKKKKMKHVQPTNIIIDLDVVGKRGLQDADIQKMLLPFTR